MKFALFLVCALVAVQGFQARSVEQSDDGLGEAIEVVQELIKKMEPIVGEIITDISVIIRETNAEAVSTPYSFQEFLGDVVGKVIEITESAGDVGQECIHSHLDQVFALLWFQLDNTKVCFEEATSYTITLKETMNVLVAKTNTLSADVNERFDYCLNEPLSKPYTQENCLSLLIETAKGKIVELEKEVANTIALAKETTEQAISIGTVCAVKVSEVIAKMEAEYLDSIKECVATSS